MPTNPNSFPKVQFRTYRSLHKQIFSRVTLDASYNERAKIMIERHLWLLTDEYELIVNNKVFTRQEELAIFDACKDAALDPERILSLEIVVAGAFRSRSLHIKWSVNEGEVRRKIAELTSLGKAALVDTAEQLWTLDTNQRRDNIKALCKSRGWPKEVRESIEAAFSAQEEEADPQNDDVSVFDQGSDTPFTFGQS